MKELTPDEMKQISGGAPGNFTSFLMAAAVQAEKAAAAAIAQAEEFLDASAMHVP